MAVGRTMFLALAMLVMAGVIITGNHSVSAQNCEIGIEGLVSECKQYVMKEGPKEKASPACCDVLKTANLPCVCKYVTPAIEMLIDIEKVIYVVETCGVPLPDGTKCGSITIPLA